jgi:hypothetical protein
MSHTLSNRSRGLSISHNAPLVNLKLMHLTLSYTDVLQIVHLLERHIHNKNYHQLR